jgi:hypothetical protein
MKITKTDVLKNFAAMQQMILDVMINDVTPSPKTKECAMHLFAIYAQNPHDDDLLYVIGKMLPEGDKLSTKIRVGATILKVVVEKNQNQVVSKKQEFSVPAA